MVQRGAIYEGLVEQIRTGRLAAGSRLPPLREQARRWQTSLATVQEAVNRLAEEGYVRKQHGRGIFVRERVHELRMSETVALLMETTGHLFAGFHQAMLRYLHQAGRTALAVDTGHACSRQMLASTLSSEARCLVIHGNLHFPWHQLEPGWLEGKTIVGVIDWETERFADRVHRVLVDHREGARLMVAHLRERGCRHAILLATDSMARAIREPGTPRWLRERNAFAEEWAAGGGTWELVAPRYQPQEAEIRFPLTSGYRLDEEGLRAALRAAPRPVALVGLLDALAFEAQQRLLAESPTALDGVQVIGYGHTPWCQAAPRPFPSVDWRLDHVAYQAARLAQLASRGDLGDAPVSLKVGPLLMTGGMPLTARTAGEPTG